MRSAYWMLSYLLLGVVLGCEIGPRSGRGLRLPEGDPDRGRVAFQELGCVSCHDVLGDPMPTTGKRAEVIVPLAGEVTRVETHGELVTSIINPSHELSGRRPREAMADGDVSKMADFNDRMTVTQLVDLTTYLQSKYRARPEPTYIP